MAAPTINAALCTQVAGPVGVWVDTDAGHALQHLGWSVDGVQIQEIPYITGIPSDLNGGTDGPPVDFQVYPSQHRIILDLNIFDPLVEAKVALRVNPAASVSPTVGMLIGCSGQYYRVLLYGANFVRNYPYCVPMEPIDFNIGSKFTRKQITFMANTIGGLLWNTTAA